MTESLHVIVIGGGIAGLCLAQGLRQAGVSVAVYERERSSSERLEGYRIHINPAGSRALKTCLPPAVWDAFVETADEPGGLGFLTEQLRPLVVIGGQPAADPAQGSHAVDRITLRRLLLSGLDDVVHFGRSSPTTSSMVTRSPPSSTTAVAPPEICWSVRTAPTRRCAGSSCRTLSGFRPRHCPPRCGSR